MLQQKRKLPYIVRTLHMQYVQHVYMDVLQFGTHWANDKQAVQDDPTTRKTKIIETANNNVVLNAIHWLMISRWTTFKSWNEEIINDFFQHLNNSVQK